MQIYVGAAAAYSSCEKKNRKIFPFKKKIIEGFFSGKNSETQLFCSFGDEKREGNEGLWGLAYGGTSGPVTPVWDQGTTCVGVPIVSASFEVNGARVARRIWFSCFEGGPLLFSASQPEWCARAFRNLKYINDCLKSRLNIN